jgi:UDP-N-acetylmuramyl tripeptide synthase
MEVSSHALQMWRVREFHFHTGQVCLQFLRMIISTIIRVLPSIKTLSALPLADAGHASYAILNVDDSSSEVYARATKATF